MHHRAHRPRANAISKFVHFGMKAAVITEAERNSSLASGVHCAFRVVFGERKRFLTEDVFSGFRRRDHLLRMYRVRRTEDYCMNMWVREKRFETFSEPQVMSIGESLELGGNRPRRTRNKTNVIAPMDRLDKRLSPPAHSYNGRINHDYPLIL